MQDQIVRLEARMSKAAEAGEFGEAALLRDLIARMRSGDSDLVEQVPGKMGLGTSQENHTPTRPLALPKRPDPMAPNHKPGGGRRR